MTLLLSLSGDEVWFQNTSASTELTKGDLDYDYFDVSAVVRPSYVIVIN